MSCSVNMLHQSVDTYMDMKIKNVNVLTKQHRATIALKCYLKKINYLNVLRKPYSKVKIFFFYRFLVIL